MTHTEESLLALSDVYALRTAEDHRDDSYKAGGRQDQARDALRLAIREVLAVKPTPEAADAFWNYWKANGETHKHGYYESTWGAINAALTHGWTEPAQQQAEPVKDKNEN